nr:TPA_asm: movement protein [Prunus humilis associated luteovirus]
MAKEKPSLQLWSMCNLEEDEEPVEAMLEETALSMPDLETKATGSLLQWTTLRQMLPGSSSSDRVFHNTQIFQMASSSPSMSTESRILRSSLTASPQAPLPVHSLLRWTLPVNSLVSNPELYPSRSTKISREASMPRSLEASSGTTLKKTNSGLFTRAMEGMHLRGRSRSRSP